jgi:hypothetical protein
MVSQPTLRSRHADRALYAISAVFLSVSIGFVLANRLPGLGYFDGSEYALHVRGGGIAHAPGYPLFTVLCRIVSACGADPFLAQQVVSIASLVVAALALFKTFALEVGVRRPGFAGSLAIAIATLSASYYLRLFSILPEVFLLNVALFSLVIWALTQFHHFPNPWNLAAVFFVYGLGLCHHHTLALTLPACVYLIASRLRQLNVVKSILFSGAGFAVGCLPLLYLFGAGAAAESTYYHVHDFGSLMFVLLRKGYGTFHLSPLNGETDMGGLYKLAFEGLLNNFNGWGALVFAPLLLWNRIAAEPRPPRDGSAVRESIGARRTYRWSNPSLLIATSAVVLFFVLFIPNCNLELSVRTYRSIFLRFLTIPCFLMVYPVFKAALAAWDWAENLGTSRQIGMVVCLLACIGVGSINNVAGLRYRNCDLLDEHVKEGYAAIFSQIGPPLDPHDDQRHQCAIYAQGDTLLMGIKYYNAFVAKEKCYVFSNTSLTGQFLDRRELQLAATTLEVDRTRLESGEFATHPEAMLNLFLKLDKKGFALFVFSVTDYTGYFGKMLVNSPFAYRPVGNILQVVTNTSAPWGMDRMLTSYESYVKDLEAYIVRLRVHGVPSEVVDSQANQALILNLADYAKFASFFPASPQAVSQLQARADTVQRQWLELLPHE